MSNFALITKHPKTGKWEKAEWIDNCFGNHIYGVQFNDGLLFNIETDKMETMTDEEHQSMIIPSAPQQDTTNGIKIDNISKRVRVFKNDFAIEADIFQNGKITIINTRQHYTDTDENTFKFIGSTPKTIKKIGELLIALSEIK